MNLFKRATISLVSTVDKTVSRLEDHDALVSAKITDMSQHIARSKMEVNKVEKADAQLQQQMQSLQQDMANWEQRATETAQTDRTKALDCLQRRNHCETQLNSIKTQRQVQAQLKQDMQARLVQMQNQLTTVKQQQTQLRNRSSQAEVERIARQNNTGATDEIDAVFNRWEEKVMIRELSHDAINDPTNYHSPQQDALESEFLAQEQQEALSSQLDGMLQQKSQRGVHTND